MEPELRAEIEKARTAAVACNLLSVELVAITEELQGLKVNLSLELQAVRNQRMAEHKEWREFMTEQRGELDRIKADFRTEATLLHLIQPEETGDYGTRKEEDGRGTARTYAETSRLPS